MNRLRRTRSAILLVSAIVALVGCSEAQEGTRETSMEMMADAQVVSFEDAKEKNEARPKLGLMTSLPLYWPLGTDFTSLARGDSSVPWQREVLERDHSLLLLDTLSPIAGLTDNAPDTDPLAGLDRIAVIQPRGLSPADNVALDEWVRDGGQLLLVLDPALTGHYAMPLGDPRRPSDTAVIPPVVERWGLKVLFDEAQAMRRTVVLDGTTLPVSLGGTIRRLEGGSHAGECVTSAQELVARCDLGAGRVTLLADAFAFEGGHEEDQEGVTDHHDHRADVADPGSNADAIASVLDYAFGD